MEAKAIICAQPTREKMRTISIGNIVKQAIAPGSGSPGVVCGSANPGSAEKAKRRAAIMPPASHIHAAMRRMITATSVIINFLVRDNKYRVALRCPPDIYCSVLAG